MLLNLTCANIAPHFRSTVDQMRLALLVCEKDFKTKRLVCYSGI